MTQYKCNACGGEYEDPLPDGMRYFHTCPMLDRVRVRRDGQAIDIDPKDQQPADVEIRRLSIERQGHRDENVNPNDRDDRQRARIRKEGAGRRELRERE